MIREYDDIFLYIGILWSDNFELQMNTHRLPIKTKTNSSFSNVC